MVVKEETKTHKIVNFIIERRIIFFGVILAITICSIGVGLYYSIEKYLNRKSQLVAESLEDAWILYTKAEDKDKSILDSAEKDLSELVALYEKESFKRYGGYRLALIKSKLAEKKENFEEAAEILEECGKVNHHPLAPLMLVQSAVFQENLKNNKKSISLLEFALKKDKNKIFTQRIAFNLGRLYENLKDLKKAREAYQLVGENIDQDFSESRQKLNYAKLAKSRLIFIDAESQKESSEDEK